MNSKNINKPILNPSLFQPSLLWAAFNISYGLGLFVLLGWVNYEVAIGPWPIIVKIILMIPIGTLAAVGLYVLALLGHEALHGNLCKNKKLGYLIGIFFSSSVMSYFDMGFVVRHWDHHRHTNQEDDPDLVPTAHLTTWWQRLLLSRIIFNSAYMKNAFFMALGKMNHVDKYQTPYESKDLVLYSRLNFLFAALWLSAYVTISIIDWRAGLYGIVMPTLILAPLAGCQSYLDHASLGDDEFTNAYTRTSSIMTLIYFGTNYHLEHHLYPKVPCYKLHKVHKALLKNGLYDQIKPVILSGFLESYKTLGMMNNKFDNEQN